MGDSNYYLMTSLPDLGELGDPPPLTIRELLAYVRECGGPCPLLEVLFLGHDLLQREALLSGEVKDAELAVLTKAQARNEAPLPGFLTPEVEASGRMLSDKTWEAYFRYTANEARLRRSAFLSSFIGHEVALRNALAAARAKALELEATDYLVAPDLGSAGEELGDVVNEWSSAGTPLEGLRILDRHRWAWLRDHEGWFSFTGDEVAAYGAKLLLLVRWEGLAQAGRRSGETAGEAGV